MSKLAKATLGIDRLEFVADHGYYTSEKIFVCEKEKIAVTLPEPQTSNKKKQGRIATLREFLLPISSDPTQRIVWIIVSALCMPSRIETGRAARRIRAPVTAVP